jgi:predicted N-acetyltransferase YhbS
MPSLPPITPEQTGDAAEVDALIEAAFGPGRLAKAAERLREGNRPIEGLSVVAREAGRIVGCARMWPVRVGDRPAILLGPFAVDKAWRSRGLGAALVEAACERTRAAGHGLVILVGDAPFFGRIGFQPVAPKALSLPGPVDMRRVMVLALREGASDDLAGPVTLG